MFKGKFRVSLTFVKSLYNSLSKTSVYVLSSCGELITNSTSAVGEEIQK